MKKNSPFIIKVFLIILIHLQLIGNDSSKLNGEMGYLIDGLSTIKNKDSRIAFDLWRDEINKNSNMNASIKYLDTEEEIIEGYKNFDFQFITMNPFFYLKNSNLIDNLTKSCLITREGETNFEQYILLVRDKEIKTFKDLKGKKIAIKNDNYIARVFLDFENMKATSKNSNKNSKISFYEMIKTKKDSTAILNTFFGKADASVVPLSTYNLVTELNPSIRKKLKPLIISERIFMPIVTFFHKEADNRFVKIITNEINVLSSTSYGKNILNLLKTKEVKQIDCKELEPIKEFYKKYEILKSSRK